jgi:protoheme IX farnesyltransferase
MSTPLRIHSQAIVGRDACRLGIAPRLATQTADGAVTPKATGPRARQTTNADIAVLTKWRIAFFNAVSATAGCMLAGSLSAWPVLGTFLLACGGAALNQIQERELDARMERTRHRPLPAHTFTLPAAWMVAIIFILAGFGVLAMTQQPVTLLLGALALVSYNLIYTPLKRVTYYAPIIGAVVGAFPPAIGWASTGAPLNHPALVGLVMYFVLWQVPHFWLLLLGAVEDYERGGFVLPTSEMSLAQLRHVTFVWILGTAAFTLLLPVFGVIQHLVVFVPLVAAAGWLVWRSWRALLPGSQPRRAFMAINYFALATLALIILDNLTN